MSDISLTWILTAPERWEAEGPQGWRAHVHRSAEAYVAWIERDTDNPLDENSAEASVEWYYTPAGAKAWCVDRLIGLTSAAAPSSQQPPALDAETAALVDDLVDQIMVRNAVVAFWAAMEPDERYDPADDPREGEALQQLALSLGSEVAARGVVEALYLLRTPPEGPGEASGLPLTPAA